MASWLGDHAGAPALPAWQGYFVLLAAVGAPLAAAGLVKLFRAGQSGVDSDLSWRDLVGTQIAAFLAIEVAEHLLLGINPAKLLTNPAFWIGVVAQVTVALAVGLLARAAVAGGRAFADARPPRARRITTTCRPLPQDDSEQRLLLTRAFSRRGPPLLRY